MTVINELTTVAINLDEMILDFKMGYQDGKKNVQLFDKILTTKGWLEKQCSLKSLDLKEIMSKHTMRDYDNLLKDIANDRVQ